MANKPNPSLVVTADGRVLLQEAPIRDPGPDEVLLHVVATGICGSDIHLWHHGRIGDITVDGDCILGHEAAAVIVSVGSNVKHLVKGDRVAIEPGVSCGRCFLCVGGRYNLCEQVAFSGIYPHHGTIQRYKTHPASHVHKIPDSISFRAAALLEPLSVVMHALRTSPITIGAPVAIFGAGPIGLLAMAAARASGACPIVITDVDAARLDFARAFEPSCRAYQVRRGDSPTETGDRIRDLFERNAKAAPSGHTESEMPQLVLECTGMESSIGAAAYTVRRGGTINVVGVSPRITIDKVPFMHMSLAEIKLLFINRYHDTWPAAIRAVEGDLIDRRKLESIVTHTFQLEDAVKAIQLVGGVSTSEKTVVKVQVVDGVC
ncbi:hypothetical protein CP533_5409 [Ophiocordyceps camponoti-saundersi (nom. inval.)]|nr:hypothetical protein CP533_5409 [Ophiocordyceps camponoti-saundersi (nom. inval.)]